MIGAGKYVMASDDDYVTGLKGRFEPAMVNIFRALAEDSEAILDIGANIGCTTILFAGLAKRVHAFEPSPTTFAFLERNICRARLHNVALQNIGLGAESGGSTLTYSPTFRAGGFVSDQTQASADHVVEAIVIRRLDEVLADLAEPQVDFMKIDVEGFEGHVLRGATRTLAAHRPVVELELNHWCLNAFQRTCVPDFLEFLASVFPILLAVEDRCYLNLHDASERYTVMHEHIVRRKFNSLVGAFEEPQVRALKGLCRHGRPA